MEGLEERGTGRILTEEEEASMFWGGGGEALRCKRRREWEEEAWGEYKVLEEDMRESMPTDTGQMSVKGVIMEMEVKGESEMEGQMTGMEGSGGNVGEVDGGGCGQDDRGGQVAAKSERKPLRGKRRGKKSIREGEQRKMANTMSRWLGIQPQ